MSSRLLTCSLLAAVSFSVAGCGANVGPSAGAGIMSGPGDRAARFPVAPLRGVRRAVGMTPLAALTRVGSNLYGTTEFGGANSIGTAFKMTQSGTSIWTHSFGAGTDGSFPVAALTHVGSLLYGTTQGGSAGFGAVVAIHNGSGNDSIVYSFQGGNDGGSPSSRLLHYGGAFYGTTLYGGTAGVGTVFKLVGTTETVLYSFQGGSDGASPFAGLTKAGGFLYGTASGGGTSGQGVVYKIKLSNGAYNVIYNFQGGTDGAYPLGDLLSIKPALYGTTERGGPSNYGTVFKITTNGVETILYAFQGGTDGAHPYANLITVPSLPGKLFGTTAFGGTSNAGTVFALPMMPAPDTVFYSFQEQPDGAFPTCGLIRIGSSLFGTTDQGGTNNNGTVFKVPLAPGPDTVLHSF